MEKENGLQRTKEVCEAQGYGQEDQESSTTTIT